jgi:hypothetical protein
MYPRGCIMRQRNLGRVIFSVVCVCVCVCAKTRCSDIVYVSIYTKSCLTFLNYSFAGSFSMWVANNFHGNKAPRPFGINFEMAFIKWYFIPNNNAFYCTRSFYQIYFALKQLLLCRDSLCPSLMLLKKWGKLFKKHVCLLAINPCSG